MAADLHPPTLAELRAARDRIAGGAVRTPLLPLFGADLPNADLPAADWPGAIYLKMENLQPVGSFKIRPGLNAIRAAGPAVLRNGVYTASSGNMAQGVAYAAREAGVSCRVYVIEGQPAQSKLDALAHLGADVVAVDFETFWTMVVEHRHPGEDGLFIHPVANQDVIAGDGTVGLEIVEQLPDVETILVPHGGGGLVSGIAAAAKAHNPDIRIVSVEAAESRPVAAALKAGRPATTEPLKSFVTGISVGPVLEDMWPLIRAGVDDAVCASVPEICEAIRQLCRRNRIVVEGGGAAPVAAAMNGRGVNGKTVCVLSGGNIDAPVLADILRGRDPG